MNLKISLLLFKQDDTDIEDSNAFRSSEFLQGRDRRKGRSCTFTRDSRSTELGIYNSSDMSFLLISRGRTLLS